MHPALTAANLTTPIMLVSAALWLAATVTAMTVGPSRTSAPPAPAANPFPVQNRLVLTALETKADRLPLFAARFPADIKQAVVPIAPSPPAALSKGSQEEPAPRDDNDRPRRASDVCQRHHMHKEITRHGKSWRCRR